MPTYAHTSYKAFFSLHSVTGLMFILICIVAILLCIVLYLFSKTKQLRRIQQECDTKGELTDFQEYITTLNDKQIDNYLRRHTLSLFPLFLIAQFPFSQTGVIITLILILIPVIGGVMIMLVKVLNMLRRYREQLHTSKEAFLPLDLLSKRKEALAYRLQNTELAGDFSAEDDKGLLKNITSHGRLPVVAIKKSGLNRPGIDPELARLVVWYIGTAAVWLLFGTTVGEYIGIKFVAPDVDHVSWLSFGRLRPVHTNAVFWGWASLGMLGLGHYIVPRISNTTLASYKKGWYSLILINTAIVLGSLCLMGGINNGGGEYREYIWPVMLLFGIGLVLVLSNFIKTIAKRTTKEIYISNWYIVAALIFGLVITVVAYVPNWQDGLGETIIQGYFMHQGVGMWFMMFTLGIVYYF
jgi:cytochrome c oxidase cbb3-type subunit 1